MAKQRVVDEICNLFRPVPDVVSSSRLLKKKVISGSLTVDEAYLSAQTAMNNLEQLYVTFKTFMEMTPDEYSYEGVEFMVGREKRGCSVSSEIKATGYLAAEGNLEFLVREALQPPTLHEFPDFKWAYDVILKGLLSMKNMRDTESEKRMESLYWISYVRRSILSIKEELEDPHAKEWSCSTIHIFLSQVKETHE